MKTVTTPIDPGAALLDGVVAEVCERKERQLFDEIEAAGRCLVAFSGGVDSSYLGWAAHRVLAEHAVAVTALSPSVGVAQRRAARELADLIGIRHQVIETRELEDPSYVRNAPDRCYHCKSELYTRLGAIAALRAETDGAVVMFDGTNADDLGDLRPGRRAATELGVRSPLATAGISKAELRFLSRRAGLPTWDRPASPCLASRVPYGTQIDEAMLDAIDRAEDAIRALGFREFRVRHHGDVARVELHESELPRAFDRAVSRAIAEGVRAAGFRYATVDLEPFRSGRLNDVLRQPVLRQPVLRQPVLRQPGLAGAGGR